MSSAIQTKTDQAIRTLTPEQLAEYAVCEKWADLKALWEKRITDQEAEDRAKIFSRKFLDPMPYREYRVFKDKYDTLKRHEETRTAFSVAVGLITDHVAVTQPLLVAIDRLMAVAYNAKEGKPTDPEDMDLDFAISFSEKIIPPSLMILEKRKRELKDYLEAMADIVTFPPDQEMVKTPQEVRDFIEKKQAGEEYQDDLIDPFIMPHIRLAKHLGVETEGREYGDICRQIRTALHNVEHWEDLEEETAEQTQ